MPKRTATKKELEQRLCELEQQQLKQAEKRLSELTCPVCRILTPDICVLPCQHLFCLADVYKLVDEPCPLCRKPITAATVAALAVNAGLRDEILAFAPGAASKAAEQLIEALDEDAPSAVIKPLVARLQELCDTLSTPDKLYQLDAKLISLYKTAYNAASVVAKLAVIPVERYFGRKEAGPRAQLDLLTDAFEGEKADKVVEACKLVLPNFEQNVASGSAKTFRRISSIREYAQSLWMLIDAIEDAENISPEACEAVWPILLSYSLMLSRSFNDKSLTFVKAALLADQRSNR